MNRKKKSGPELIFEEESSGFERLIILCDGIFAIAMTLLILDIKLPNEPPNATIFSQELNELLGKSIYYLLTFITLAGFWMSNRRLMVYVKRQDSRFAVLTFVFLAFVIFFPVSLNVLEGHVEYPQAVVLYTLILAGCGFSSFLLWTYASWNHRLIKPEVSDHEIRTRALGILITPSYFCLSLLLLLIPGFSPVLLFFSWVLLPFVFRLTHFLNNVFERRLEARKQAAEAPPDIEEAEPTPTIEGDSSSSGIA